MDRHSAFVDVVEDDIIVTSSSSSPSSFSISTFINVHDQVDIKVKNVNIGNIVINISKPTLGLLHNRADRELPIIIIQQWQLLGLLRRRMQR